MPASRIAFAIGDLMAEIRRLLPRDTKPVVELRLEPQIYQKVKDELGHHFGRPFAGAVMFDEDGPFGEQFRLAGLTISTSWKTGDA